MNHIDRIIWKPINWRPESPDQYPDGLPIPKPEGAALYLANGREMYVVSKQFGEVVTLTDVQIVDGRRFASEIAIPSDRLMDVVDSLLYIYRRTHEHEFQGPDAGLTDESLDA